MKKTLNVGQGLVVFLLFFVLSQFSFSANAQDCERGVIEMCKAFNNMAVEIDKCNSLENIDNLNFDNAINATDLNQIPDECENYNLTKKDKNLLKDSVNNFINSMVNKLSSLTGLDKEDCKNQFSSMKTQIYNCIDSSVTLGELMEKMANI